MAAQRQPIETGGFGQNSGSSTFQRIPGLLRIVVEGAELSMADATEFFLPAARFAGHVLASASGFVVLAAVALIPVFAVKLLVLAGGGNEFIQLFHWIETGVLYLDATSYICTVLVWTIVFLIEEVRAARKILGW
jgi:hypothetical protein